MDATFTYNPARIKDGGRDKMRFEIGDTMVECGPETAYLSDEEIDAMLALYPRWNMAKLKCLESIIHRFMYEPDTKVGQLSLSLGERFSRIKAMYDDLKKTAESGGVNPMGARRKTRPPYFREGMHDNRAPAGRGRRPSSCTLDRGTW